MGVASAGGAVAVGVCGVEPLTEARRVIEQRRDAGLHGGMDFTFRNPARSTEPTRALPSARSALVAALAYPPQRPAAPEAPAAAVARYAASDLYATLRAALRATAEVMAGDGYRGVVVADDNALVDRAMAHRAGLGWFGKNTNLLLPGIGSWVVLGSVLTDAPLPPTVADGDVVADQCGACRRCLDACPTGALVAPGVMDASRCLSWLLQMQGPFPREHREALGPRIYGCDDCQEVCPPNRRAPEPTVALAPGPGDWVELRWLLEATDDELLGALGAWYIPRRDPRYLRRNALVALGNTGRGDDPVVARLLEAHLRSDDALLVGHAAWAARRLCADHLLAAEGVRDHPEVGAELARPHPSPTTPGGPPGGPRRGPRGVAPGVAPVAPVGETGL